MSSSKETLRRPRAWKNFFRMRKGDFKVVSLMDMALECDLPTMNFYIPRKSLKPIKSFPKVLIK